VRTVAPVVRPGRARRTTAELVIQRRNCQRPRRVRPGVWRAYDSRSQRLALDL